MLISASPSEYFRIEGTPQAPTPEVRVDSNFGTGTETYRGSPEFLVPVRVADATPAGRINLRMTVRSQACSDKICLEPTTAQLTVPVVIDPR